VFWERDKEWKHLCELLEHGNPELWADILSASNNGIDAYGQKSIIEFFQRWYGIVHYNVVEKGKEEGATYRVPTLRIRTIENFRYILGEMEKEERYPSRDIFELRRKIEPKKDRLRIDHLNGFVDESLEWLAKMKHVVRIEDLLQLERSYRHQLNAQAAYDRLEGIFFGEVPYTSALLGDARHHQFRKGVDFVDALTNCRTPFDLAIREKVSKLFQQPSSHTLQRAYLLDPQKRLDQ
jgi:hypothetical protein